MTHRTQPLARRATTAASAAVIALALGTLGCNSTDSPNQTEVPEGTYSFDRNFFVDSNFGGIATEVRIERQYYGRLVTIESCTPEGGLIEVVQTDFVIDPREADTWSEPFTLVTNPVDGSQTLCIAEDVTDTTVDPVLGSSPRERFLAALIEAAGGVRPVTDLGFVGQGNYTMVPRNAAFVIQFDDLIDPSTINAESIRVVQGNPAIIPFSARVFADPNYGGLANFDGQPGSEFYPTRIIIDPSISATESLATGLSANLTGFPASANSNLANVQVRLATQQPIGQVNPILQNPSDHPLVTSENGTFDFGSAARDLVRAFRSGGQEDITGDPFSGFLPDDQRPEILGALGSTLAGPFTVSATDPLEFRIPTVTFNSIPCAQSPVEGDVIVTNSGISALVLRNNPNSSDTSSGSFEPLNGVASNVRVRVLTPVPAQFQADPGAAFAGNGAGAAQYTVCYDDNVQADGGDRQRPECFINVTPNSAQFPASPNVAIFPEATFSIRFSEPMNAEVLEPYESIRLTRHRPEPEEQADYISGRLTNDLGLQEFTFRPAVPLEHSNGSTESFFLSFPDTEFAPRDLAGNALNARLRPFIEFTVESTAPDSLTGSRTVLFNSRDEDAPFGDLTTDVILDRLPRAEWGGQLSYDLINGRIRPRSVVREQVFATAAQEIVAAMSPNLVSTTLPLNPRGARTQFIWRDTDFGLSLYEGNNFSAGLDINRLNMDVEAAYLSPEGGNSVFESYPEFTMNMAHSMFLPNEFQVIGPALSNPNSGLVGTYSANLLDQTADALQEVHARELGFTINPGDQSLTPDGLTTLIPLPMNQGIPEEDKRFYTWRDTAIMTTGAPSTTGGPLLTDMNAQIGAPVWRVSQVSQFYPLFHNVGMFGLDCFNTTAPIPTYHPLYRAGFVRTAGLPLLLDFRCFNSGTASTGNRFDHNNAFAFSTFPNFRAFSAGGTNEAGAITIIDPDSETNANGGFDPTSIPPGAETSGLDNVVYFGALDLVVRVSRTVSIFFPTVDPSSFSVLAGATSNYSSTYINPSFVEPTMFPNALNQPQGTSVELAYRGTGSEILEGNDARVRADMMDPYGDFFPDLPINFSAGADEIPDVSVRGNASCLDGSFVYRFVDDDNVSQINMGVDFLNGDQSWRTSVDGIQGARFFQVRVSFTSNTVTGETPSLSSLGFAWENN